MTEKNNTPMFSDVLALVPQPIKLILELSGYQSQTTQMDMLPLPTASEALRFLSVQYGDDIETNKSDLFDKTKALPRMPVEGYFLVQFSSVAVKQLPLFSEEELPSASSALNFIHPPKGYCPSDPEISERQKSPLLRR